jgi:protein SCO1/2
MKNKLWIIGILFGLLVGALLAALVIPRLLPPRFHGTVIQSPDPAPNFKLVGQDGQPVSLQDFKGKVVVLYFGYTYCPDVCPATLSVLAGALRTLGKKADDIQVIMVTVDPERDTPEKLASYVQNFYPTFMGLSGTPEQIAEAATLYGIYFAKNAGDSPENYTMDHTASLMVIDQTGRLKLVLPFGMKPSDVAEDLAAVLR